MGDYALYKGDELLSIGTVEEIAKRMGIKKKTIAHYKTPTYLRKIASRKSGGENAMVLVGIDDEEMLKEIAREIIKTVQDESVLSCFQYIVYYEEIEEKFNLRMTREIANEIVKCLEGCVEVADVELDADGFDVVLYMAYAPNYEEEQD